MFRREERLIRGKTSVVRKRGRSVHTKAFSARFLPEENEESHFAVLVSARLFPQAVVRSRLKRKIKLLVQKNKKLLHRPASVVLSLTRGGEGYSIPELETAIVELFTKIKDELS